MLLIVILPACSRSPIIEERAALDNKRKRGGKRLPFPDALLFGDS